MRKFVILADNGCDLSKECRDYFDMTDYVTGHLHLPDGREITTKLEWDFMSSKEFYAKLSRKNSGISTSPSNSEEYYKKFESYIKEGYDILSISLSSTISATYRFAVVAANNLKEKYPDCRIYCVDSYRVSMGFGLLVAYAHELKRQGKTMDEIIDWLEVNKYKVHQMGPIDNLFFAAKRGRISMGKAVFGSFAGIKPMGDYSPEGYTSVITKVKGINKALDVTVQYVKRTIVNPEEQYIFIAHSERFEAANELKNRLEKEIKCKHIFVSEIYCSCATNIGDGMISVNYLGDKISAGLVKENEVMNAILQK
ncbi:MAG: DegV family protein [Bacilli bacterium]|nr:DegV family EDD domain-containing protein [Mollicutes bacterium]MDY3899509.1 DegV family protein [Bacilli bacterium]